MPRGRKKSDEPKEHRLISFKLHEIEDRDLIELLDKVPKTYLIKTALRYFQATNPGILYVAPNKINQDVGSEEEKEPKEKAMIDW